jgi:putative endonuclease
MRITSPAGRLGERLAAAHLRARGLRILGRNVRVHAGEADLVARDDAMIVLVEVKTRVRRPGAPERSLRTPPEASVTAHKRAKLRQVARALIVANGWQERPVRIDVIAVELTPSPGRVNAMLRALGLRLGWRVELRHYPGA